MKYLTPDEKRLEEKTGQELLIIYLISIGIGLMILTWLINK